jgi:hypothetical protein
MDGRVDQLLPHSLVTAGRRSWADAAHRGALPGDDQQHPGDQYFAAHRRCALAIGTPEAPFDLDGLELNSSLFCRKVTRFAARREGQVFL